MGIGIRGREGGTEKARQEGANCRAEGSHMGGNRDAYGEA